MPFTEVAGNRGGRSMVRMLEALGLSLLGRHHSGIDDARNIAAMCSELLWRELPHDRDELGPVRFLAPQMAPRLHCFALTGGGCWLLVWVHGLHAKVDRLAAHRDYQRWSRTEARVAALEASALRIEAYVRTVP